MQISRRCCWLLASTIAALSGPALAASAPEVWHARVQVPSATPAVVYVQVRTSGELRLASSPEGLATASPVRPRRKETASDRSGFHTAHFTFPETPLPVRPDGVERMTAIFSFSHIHGRQVRRGPSANQTSLSARVCAVLRDDRGAKWSYVAAIPVDAPLPLAAGAPARSAPLLQAPAVHDLKLKVETLIEGTKARIGLRVTGGDVPLSVVLKDGRMAPCTLSVLSADGKVLRTVPGDLEQFGFT